MNSEIITEQTHALPLVTQVGFAGARELFSPDEHTGIDQDRFNDAVADELSKLLRKLPSELGLPQTDFLCGISALAVGGDMAFARACQSLGIPQRLFLPQHFDAFLDATNLKEKPDFDLPQQQAAKDMQSSGHIIETRVASNAHDRHDRFHDTNLEIARVSDVIVCLIRAGQEKKSGGTLELVEHAERLDKPALVIEVAVGENNQPSITCDWRNKKAFVQPSLPEQLVGNVKPFESEGTVPNGQSYCNHLKEAGSDTANRLRGRFKKAASIIVGGHVLATGMALIAIYFYAGWVLWVLGIEIVLLICGLTIHTWLHRDHSISRWATFRLTSEVSRSVKAINNLHVYSEHFFKLPFPDSMRALLRTINVLHLRDSSAEDAATGAGLWQARRDAYVKNRLCGPAESAEHLPQVPYNEQTYALARFQLRVANGFFYGFSALAILATLAKLLTLMHVLPFETGCTATISADTFKALIGSFAVLFPVIAVAALSLAAAFDLGAREHTSDEMLHYLTRQRAVLEYTTSKREFERLVIETETRLLGETVNWYARRSFVGVT